MTGLLSVLRKSKCTAPAPSLPPLSWAQSAPSAEVVLFSACGSLLQKSRFILFLAACSRCPYSSWINTSQFGAVLVLWGDRVPCSELGVAQLPGAGPVSDVRPKFRVPWSWEVVCLMHSCLIRCLPSPQALRPLLLSKFLSSAPSFKCLFSLTLPFLPSAWSSSGCPVSCSYLVH